MAVVEETTLETHRRNLTAAERMSAGVTMGLALLAIVLLAAGCLSLFLSMVRDSRRELAIRIALGATGGALWRRIVTQGLVITLAGLAVGLAGARVVGTRIAAQLYQVAPADPLTLVAVSALVVLVGLAAVHVASRLAIRTSPVGLLKASRPVLEKGGRARSDPRRRSAYGDVKERPIAHHDHCGTNSMSRVSEYRPVSIARTTTRQN